MDSQVKYGVLSRGQGEVFLRLPRYNPKKHFPLPSFPATSYEGKVSVGTFQFQLLVYETCSRAGYVENIWDHAAGAVVVTEAGGVLTDATGKTLDFAPGVWGGLCI